MPLFASLGVVFQKKNLYVFTAKTLQIILIRLFISYFYILLSCNILFSLLSNPSTYVYKVFLLLGIFQYRVIMFAYFPNIADPYLKVFLRIRADFYINETLNVT